MGLLSQLTLDVFSHTSGTIENMYAYMLEIPNIQHNSM